MNELYAQLYDITNTNIQKAGKQLDMTKDAFMFKQANKEGYFDVSLCGDCDNISFLQIAYLGMLGRMPDPGARKNWGQKAGMDKNAFRRELIAKISSSEEFAKRDVKIINNIYNNDLVNKGSKISPIYPVMRKVRQKGYNFMRKVYSKFPEGCKKVIRKIIK